MHANIKELLLRNLSNVSGWRTKRRIVVFESDDWGSIRMPSIKVFDKLNKAGLDLTSGDSYRYNKYDTLADVDDLSCLFETLTSVKDKYGNPASFTAISVVANPDFKKIKEFDFQIYYYEPFTDTLKRNKGSEKSFELWEEGKKIGIFMPQFHGREHLNVLVWLKALQDNDQETLLAFNNGLWGFKNKHPYNISYQAAFDMYSINELQYHHKVIIEGLQLFERIHGIKARYFVPPNGPFNNQLEETAAKYGIRYMSASKIQKECLGAGRTRLLLHYIGQRNKWGQAYITRNCFFEPSLNGKDWLNSCLSEISIAFRMQKPAIISSHRVYYIGALYPVNRDRGLKQLKTLLNSIIQKWPDVEFMPSNQLGNLL